MIRRAAALRRRAPIGAVLAACSLALSACPSPNRAPRPQPSPSVSAQSTLPPKGEIRVAWPHEPATLNPFLRGGESPATRALVRPLMPSLFVTGPGGATQPSLVEKIVAESPREVRFTIRPGAVWSDGQPITAADVRFTWKTIMDRRWPVASRDGYDAIGDVQAESPSAVRITFTRDVPAWRDLFSAGLGVLPEHALKDQDFPSRLKSEWPVSGGPFVLERYTRGLEMVLAASPKPWGPRAAAERIRISFVPDSTTALQLLRAGKIDVVGPYESPDFSRRLKDAGATVTTDTGGTWTGLVLNARSGVLADGRVRSALALAVDADDLVSGLVRGEGERLRHPFAFPVLPDDPGRVDQPGDPAAAARLLDQAGFTRRGSGTRTKGSTELKISIASVGSDDLTQRVVRGVFAHLDDAGFAVDLVALEDEQLWRDWLPSTRMQAAVVTIADPPGGALRARYHSGQIIPAGLNIARIADPALDAAVAGTDLAASDLAAAANRLAALAVVVPLWRAAVVAGARPGIQGVRAVASADGFFADAAAWRPAA